MVTGAPLENARHLAQRYDKLRQETEAQVRFPTAIDLSVCFQYCIFFLSFLQVHYLEVLSPYLTILQASMCIPLNPIRQLKYPDAKQN